MATKSKTKPAPEPEVEEAEDDLELEDVDEDVEGEGASKSKAQEVTFGVADLAKYLTKKTGKEYSTRDLRTLIRKMAREDNARVQREIVAGNRSRYDWPDGLKDPEVIAIVKAVTGGELEEGKKEALNKLKESQAKKKAEAAAKGETVAKKSKSKGKAKPAAPVVENDDEELEDIEDDEDE